MQKKTLLTLLSIVAFIIALYVFRQENRTAEELQTSGQKNRSRKGVESTSGADHNDRQAEFNRRPTKIIYTKHARCRMDCRQIDETEVKDILESGRINQEKSDPASRPDPRYALEGRTDDGQEVRIVFAAADEGMVVITVIDLQKEWSCNCK